MKKMNNNLYVLPIPRSEVENGDIGSVNHYIKQFEKIKAPSQCLDILFSGYDDSDDEVFEIADVRKWVEKVLKSTPELLYYTSVKLGTVTRLLACAYDFETVSMKRMNAYEVNEYVEKHGEAPQQPIILDIPHDELSRLFAAIKGYGIKRKDVAGSVRVVKEIKDLLGDDLKKEE